MSETTQPQAVSDLDIIDDTPNTTAEAPTTETSETTKTEEPKTDFVVRQQNVTMAYETFSPVKEMLRNKETVSLPSDYIENVARNVGDAPNLQLDDTISTKEWAETIKTGQELSSFNNVFLNTLDDPTAAFAQEVPTTAGNIKGSHPGFKDTGSETIKGERAVLRVMSHLGLGSIFRFPLYSTGIWLTVKAPAEAELLELNRLNVADKITFGRNSYGLAFSNLSSMIADRLITFVLDHVYQTNLKTDKDLRDVISCQDLPTLIWGMANAIYPQGFQYQRSCTCNPEKCQHVTKERLNLSKIHWTNTRAFTPWQLTHLSSKLTANSITDDSVIRYKEELLASQKRQVTFNTDNGSEVKFTLKVPTLGEYLESGHRWIGDITTMVNRALGIDAGDSERNQYILKHGQATAMRQYIHWVESMDFNGAIIDDRESIEKIFDVLSADDILRDSFLAAVSKYIDDTAISVVGIPTYTCPNCHGEQKPEKELPRITNIIPIDPYQTFFTLLVQRLQKIQAR